MNNPVMRNFNNGSKRTFYLVRISILAALSFVLMLFEFPLPNLFPAFLQLDASQIPVAIGTFSMGPLSGIAILFIKDVLHLFVSATQGVGELADFLVGAAFVVTSGFIYKYNKTRKGAVLAMSVGTLITVIAATVLNYFLFIPLFELVLDYPLDAIIAAGTEINKSIVDLKTLCVLSIAPFNLLKWVAITVLTSLVYKKVSPMLHM